MDRVLILETVDPLGPLETVGLLADRWMKLRTMKRTKKIMRINSLMKINTQGSLSSTFAITGII